MPKTRSQDKYHIRPATTKDISILAEIHLNSWQLHYRDSFSDHYLDEIAPTERLEVWTKRMTAPEPNMRVLVIEKDEKVSGFVCFFLGESDQHGALIDNLHVLKPFQGLGLGKALMDEAAKIIKAESSSPNFYLLVLSVNLPSIAFYKRQGGQVGEEVWYDNPGGEGKSLVKQMLWRATPILDA